MDVGNPDRPVAPSRRPGWADALVDLRKLLAQSFHRHAFGSRPVPITVNRHLASPGWVWLRAYGGGMLHLESQGFLRRLLLHLHAGVMGDEGPHVGIFLDDLVGRLARAVARSCLDADEVRTIGRASGRERVCQSG